MAQAPRDQNQIASLLAVSNVDGVTPVVLYADPVTHRLLVSSAGGAGTGDFNGPASSTDNAIVRFDGATGKIGQDSGILISDANALSPASNDAGALGTTALMWSDLFLASGAVLNFNNGNVVLTHSAGILTMGTGEMRITTPGTNAASVVTIGGTQTLTNKTLTSPVVNSPTGIVKGDVGLGNVDNTSDANKPVSSATQTALDLKSNLASPTFTGTVTTSALVTTIADTVNLVGVTINQNDVTNNPLAATFINAGSNYELELQNTRAGANGSILSLYHNSATPAANDVIGEIYFQGKDAAGNKTNYSKIFSAISDTSNGSEDAYIAFEIMSAGAMTRRMTFESAINGLNVGSGSADAILQSNSNTDLILRTGNATTGNITIADGANGNITITPDGTGQIILAKTALLSENASIALDPAGSADGKYSGITVTGTAGATLAFGDLVYLAAADSRWELADADSVTTSGDVMLGMVVLAAGADGNATNILLHGIIRADAAFPALTISAQVYVSTTAGDIQVAQPSGTDDVIRVVGRALTADEIYFNPSEDYITHI